MKNEEPPIVVPHLMAEPIAKQNKLNKHKFKFKIDSKKKMIQLNNIETKYFGVLESRLSIQQLENWIYKSEEILKYEISQDEYNELIILNFKSKDSLNDIEKIINLDINKFYRHKMQNHLVNIIDSKSSKVSSLEFHSLDSMPITFKIGNLNFAMDYPYKTQFSTELKSEININIFERKFGNVTSFLNMLIELIEANTLKVCMPNSNVRDSKDDFVFVIDNTYAVVNFNTLNCKLKEPGYNK